MINRPNEPVAMNKTIQQPDHQMSAYPSALLNPYNRYTHYSPHAPVFTPNGVLTTTPYKTVAKDYGMEFARLREPINTQVSDQLTQAKRSRQPIIFKDAQPKDYIIKDSPIEDIEVNPDETRTVTKGDKNFLNTPDAVELDYVINPSKEFTPRGKQLFRYVDAEFNNMLPDYLRNQKQNNERREKQTEKQTREKFTNNYSRNERYAELWQSHSRPNIFNRFDSIDTDKETFAQNDNKLENKKITDRYEIYESQPEHIQNNDSLEEVDNTVETFQGATNYTTSVDNYMTILKSQATALICFVKQNKDFAPWAEYWNYLDANIHKQDRDNLLFQQLESSDADVAFVQNKGEKMKFRIRDKMRFVPISIYTYVLIHEMAHLANGHEWGHGEKFQMLMHLLEVAGFEIGILKVKDYPQDPYYSDGIQILTKESIKHELFHGIDTIIHAGGNQKFYNDMLGKIADL